MHVIISAQFCEFKETSVPGVTMMSTMLFSDQISQQTVEVKNKADLNIVMLAELDRVKAAYPGRSFYVSQFQHRQSGRAFAGYKSCGHRMEYNANKESAPTPEIATA